MATVATRPQIGWVAACSIVAWLGLYVHNRLELPHLTILSPENSLPALIFGTLLLAWIRLSHQRSLVLLFLGWALLHLVGGGIISVLPLSVLPFYPEQSVQHYVMHLLYGAAQLPLIGLLLRHLRER